MWRYLGLGYAPVLPGVGASRIQAQHGSAPPAAGWCVFPGRRGSSHIAVVADEDERGHERDGSTLHLQRDVEEGKAPEHVDAGAQNRKPLALAVPMAKLLATDDRRGVEPDRPFAIVATASSRSCGIPRSL